MAKTDIFRIIAVAVVVAAGLTGCGGERDKGVQSSLNHTEQDTIVRDTIHQNTIDIEEARSDFSQLGKPPLSSFSFRGKRKRSKKKSGQSICSTVSRF